MRDIVTSTTEQQVDIYKALCVLTQLSSNIWRSFSNSNWSRWSI